MPEFSPLLPEPRREPWIARYVNAGPDMLAALRRLVYQSKDGHWYVSFREDVPVDFAGEAIRKAEGKAR